MGSFSPWGFVQSSTRVVSGVRWVSTPSHGGLMVAEATASKYLSEAALAAGERWGGYYCYEEDCQWAVAFYERPEWEEAMDKAAERKLTLQDTGTEWEQSVRARMLLTLDERKARILAAFLAYWNDAYLRASGLAAKTICPTCGDVRRPYRREARYDETGWTRRCTSADGGHEAETTLTPLVCTDPRHETPCPQPCGACRVECPDSVAS